MKLLRKMFTFTNGIFSIKHIMVTQTMVKQNIYIIYYIKYIADKI